MSERGVRTISEHEMTATQYKLVKEDGELTHEFTRGKRGVRNLTGNESERTWLYMKARTEMGAKRFDALSTADKEKAMA